MTRLEENVMQMATHSGDAWRRYTAGMARYARRLALDVEAATEQTTARGNP